MRHLFIINPAAGGGKTLKLIPEIKKIFENNPGDCIIEITKCPGDATRIAQKYTSNENLRVYSVGGDGTLYEVLNGIVGTESSLALIPSGTGNDFIKSFFPKYDEKTILKNTVEGSEKLIDCAKVNGRYYLNIASLGYDAEIIHDSVKYKKCILLPGRLAYIFSILVTPFKYKSKHIIMDLDGKVYEDDVLLIAIANGKYYGGGVQVSPHSVLDDGKLNIIYIKSLNILKIFRFLLKFSKGNSDNIKEVNSFIGKKAIIRCDHNIFINIDGEVIETDEAVFEIVPGKIKFVIPDAENVSVSKKIKSTQSLGC